MSCQPIKMNICTQFLMRTLKQFYEDECNLRAAGLAFLSLLSLVPLMVVGISLLSAFPAFKGVSQEIQNFLFANFVTESAQVAQQHIIKFVDQAKQLPLTGLIFLVTTALLMIFNMEAAMNNIWRVTEHRKGLSAFLLYWTLLTLVPLLFGVSFVFAAYLSKIPYVAKLIFWGKQHFGSFLVSVLLSFLAFIFLYIAIPNCNVSLKHAALGSTVATVLFELTKYLLSLYFIYFPTYQVIYGALAFIPIFLIWIHICWAILLFGGVVSYVSSTWERCK